MLIDHEKFVALVVENTGIEEEKVAKYIEELITEIKTAFEEGEGYEIDGFGIFSQLGNNVLFIPSDELETEINYKYVGMEPIELPGGGDSNVDEITEETPEEEIENPIQGILDAGGGDNTPEEDRYADVEDPFAELFNEKEDAQEEESEEEVEEESIEEEIDDEALEDVFQEISDEQEEEADVEEEVIDEAIDVDQEDSEIDEAEDLQAELNNMFTEEEDASDGKQTNGEEAETPGPEKWGVDAHKEEDQEGAFAGLFGDSTDEEMLTEEDIFDDDSEDKAAEQIESEQDQKAEEEQELETESLEDELDLDIEEDFDDPFAELEETDDDEDFVPVVTNVSSGKSKKEKAEEKASDEEEKSDKKAKPIGSKNPRDQRKSAPVALYLVLALVILGGTGYLLAYFGVINIQGITPSNNTQVAQNTTPPETQTPPAVVNNEDLSNEENQQISEDEVSTPQMPEAGAGESEELEEVENQAQTNVPENTSSDQEETLDLVPPRADEKWPDNEEERIISPVAQNASADQTYGLNGQVTEAGNNGYTIVLYTLSKKAGADAQQQKLTNEGYRVIIKQKPSDTYGTLYRVSIGQFETLADAAIAAEKVSSDILGNYIITKI